MPQKLRNGEKFPELDAKNIHGVPVSVVRQAKLARSSRCKSGPGKG